MGFRELNQKRRAVKQFSDKLVEKEAIYQAIEMASLSPSAHNIQPWHFVLVKERKHELAVSLPELNQKQVASSQYVIALFTDTALSQRSLEIAELGKEDFPESLLTYLTETMPKRFAAFDKVATGEYLALNAGIVVMNLVLTLTEMGLGSNIILGFDKSKLNSLLEVDKRYRPELLVTVGYSNDNSSANSYRLPIEHLIEER
ncbi:nitroreductase family protein [Streptococcus sp. zg-JUN1979]|uniref:nitroreductase family protein n=1 Tax=Streptococcus sp. zg-JUN1979 TaxID=3391450 RepID=UPI0039A53A25